MKIPLSFKRMFLEPGKTFAVPTIAGARLRVVDGMVWATTSSNPDDVWLGAGEEHTLQNPGLTVIESVARSTVELIPPPATPGTRGHIMNRYEIKIPRAACNIAAIAMTAITMGLLVILPARMGSDRHEFRQPLTSNVLAVTPVEAVDSRLGGTVKPAERTITQAASGVAPPTRSQ
jgi:hypothetical protein